MTEVEFQNSVKSLREIPFREDFEAVLIELYSKVTPAQRDVLRDRYTADRLGGSTTWKNPGDYFRSDLTREQRAGQWLMLASIREGGPDYRDDLMSIAHCYHNLALRGLDAGAVLEKIATMSGPRFGSLMRGFVTRPSAGKSMEAFGLTVEQTPDGSVADFK